MSWARTFEVEFVCVGSTLGFCMSWPSTCPPPDAEVLLRIGPGESVRFSWGDATAFGTPAYWIAQYLLTFGHGSPPDLALGSTLAEETVACLLGGYGVPAEMGLAAFDALQRKGLLVAPASARAIEEALRAPIAQHAGQPRYRFPRQRAARVAAALDFFAGEGALPQEPRSLRDSLLRINGVGLKTASWIVRNFTGSDEVAIVDIHLQRAGVLAGFFSADWVLPRDYLRYEQAFLAYARAGCVPASGLDVLIWDQMRQTRRRVAPTVIAEAGAGVPIEELFPPVRSRA